MVIFGQELPEATASLASQVFGLCVALVGLATFALVLALLQQVMDIPSLAMLTLWCRKMRLDVRFGSFHQNWERSSSSTGEGVVIPVLLQVVLEVIEENVAQGSRVYEQGHVSLLSSLAGVDSSQPPCNPARSAKLALSMLLAIGVTRFRLLEDGRAAGAGAGMGRQPERPGGGVEAAQSVLPGVPRRRRLHHRRAQPPGEAGAC